MAGGLGLPNNDSKPRLFDISSVLTYPCLVFAQVDCSGDEELDAQIRKTSHDIKDVKAVVMGYLHLNHARSLENFKGTQVPIYVHEEELKHPFYSVATKSDLGRIYSITLHSISTGRHLPLP